MHYKSYTDYYFGYFESTLKMRACFRRASVDSYGDSNMPDSRSWVTEAYQAAFETTESPMEGKQSSHGPPSAASESR